MSRLVSTLSLDGDRISAELMVHFQRALSAATGEAIADEVARATTEVLGEQISQGEIPLSKEELIRRVRARISASAMKVSEVEVKALHLFGMEGGTNRSTYRTRASSPPPPPQKYGSGAMPAVRPSSSFPAPVFTPPPPPRVRTLWPSALIGTHADASAEQLGHLLGPALRDSTAAAMLHALVVVDPASTDRLAMFGSGGAVIDELSNEVCACFASAAFRIFLSNEVDQKTSSELIRVASRHALPSRDFPAQQVSQYMASDSPVRDLAIRMAAALGTPNLASVIQAAISPYCEALRDDLLSVATQIQKLRGVG